MDDATEVTAEQLSRGISVIMFFTTSCPDCRQTLPLIQTLYDEYASKEVRFVLISRQEGRESIERYWRENGLTLPYSAQNDRVVYELFAQTRVPRVYICKDGIIKAIFTDQPQNPSYDELSSALNVL
jgi:thiol-disulfide isomerase/thioredoxin